MVETLKRYAKAGEPLAVWGWASALYVDSGMVQATREGQTQPQINPGKWRSYFRQRYVDDLLASNAPVFVDAVGPGNYISSRRYAHESMPVLEKKIATAYTFIAEIGSVRVYVHNDRLQSLHQLSPSVGLH